MKLLALTAFLASCSLSLACVGMEPCHDGPYNPAMERVNSMYPNKKSNPFNGFAPLDLGSTKKTPFKFPSRKQSASKSTPKMARRDPSFYDHPAHYARDEMLEARGYYDDDDLEIGGLYARESEFDDELLYGREADEYDGIDLDIRDFDEEYVTLVAQGSSPLGGSGGWAPRLPVGADPSGHHLFIRLDTVPKAYPPFGGSVDHAGLNKLMADMGGQHVDVVYGSPSKGYRECGLALVDMAWTRTHSNADGYPVDARCRQLLVGGRDEYAYVGQYDGRSVESLCKGTRRPGLGARR